MCILGWHRQLRRNRMQFGGAAVPLSWFVEQVDLVLLSRTSNMLIWWVGVLSCLVFLRIEEFRRGDVRNNFGHTRSKVTTWIGTEELYALDDILRIVFLCQCSFFCTVTFIKPRHIQNMSLEAVFGCVSGACPRVPTVRGQNGCDSANDSFRRCRWSEALTFGASCICDAFWRREIC